MCIAMYRLIKYVEITRPVNSFMTGIGIVFALLLYRGWRPDPILLLIGFITGFLGTASTMIINDVVDREVDKINKPWKPIPSGYVDPFKATVLSIILLVTAITINIYVGLTALATATVYGLIGYCYSLLRRYWWSHFLVAFSTTAPTIYGYVLAGTPSDYLNLAIFYTLTIFTATLGREVVKAVMDMEGDKRYGYVTIPIKYGVEKARKIILATGLAAPLLGVLTGVLAGTTIYYYILIMVTGIIYGTSMYEAYKWISDKQVLENTRRKTLAAMMIGLIAFLVSKF